MSENKSKNLKMNAIHIRSGLRSGASAEESDCRICDYVCSPLDSNYPICIRECKKELCNS
jgi:hypothetical protein